MSLTESTQSSASFVSYDNIQINVGNAFNSFQSRYFAPVDGLYVFYTTASLPPNMTADIRLVGTPDMSNILRSTHCNCGETLAMREDMQLLIKNTDMWISSDNPLNSDNITFPTSFGGFFVNSFVKSIIAFAVRLTKPHSQQGNIPFDNIYYQSSVLWNTPANVFIAPKGGLYYFSVSVGTTMGLVVVSLRVNKNSAVQLYSFCDDSTCGTETISQSSLLRINRGDEVSVYLETGTVFSDLRYQTSFFSFLYDTVFTKVAWSLQLTRVDTDKKEPLFFDVVLVNEGDGWNSVSQTYEVPIDGYYFVHFSALGCYSTTLNLQLLLNRKVMANIYQEATNADCVKRINTKGRDIILHLNKSDVLQMRLLNDGCVLTDERRKVFSFVGFRLF